MQKKLKKNYNTIVVNTFYKYLNMLYVKKFLNFILKFQYNFFKTYR